VKPFAVKDLEGKTLKLADLSGKVAVIDFWATWCKPCVHRAAGARRVPPPARGQDKVVLLSFNVGEKRQDVQAFLKKSPVSFPVYVGDALVEPLELAAFPDKADRRRAQARTRRHRDAALPPRGPHHGREHRGPRRGALGRKALISSRRCA
jgi:thiol-disulfide isomerase/thioredoxin